MNYEKIYNSLIDRARNRALTGYKVMMLLTWLI